MCIRDRFNVIATSLAFVVYTLIVLSGVQKDDPQAPHPAIIYVAQLIGMSIAVAIIWGVTRIQKRQNHSSAVVTAALASLPVGVCCLVTLPIDLYCLITIYDKDVKHLFQ